MPLFDEWCECEATEDGRKRLLKFTERQNGRAAIAGRLPDLVRSHYDDMQRVAEDIAALGYAGAAALLAERLPRTARARSGELGEIFASELVEQHLGFSVPVRRLRYKDGREMALRGDDFLGIEEVDGRLAYLKGEAKSGQAMAAGVINAARARLNDDDGRPTPISLLFVADRLLEGSEEDEALGRQIRNAVGRGTIRARDVTHGLFTLTGNDRRADLEADLAGAGGDHGHISVNLRINDHQEFIAWIYEEAESLGND